jgi:hypothetical protein
MNDAKGEGGVCVLSEDSHVRRQATMHVWFTPPSFVLLGVDKSYLSQDLRYRQGKGGIVWDVCVFVGGWGNFS